MAQSLRTMPLGRLGHRGGCSTAPSDAGGGRGGVLNSVGVLPSLSHESSESYDSYLLPARLLASKIFCDGLVVVMGVFVHRCSLAFAPGWEDEGWVLLELIFFEVICVASRAEGVPDGGDAFRSALPLYSYIEIPSMAIEDVRCD